MSARGLVSNALRWSLREALRARLGGAHLGAAARACDRLGRRGLLCTTGYWNDGDDTPATVHRETVRGIALLARRVPDGYLSVKFPALGAADALAEDVFARAADAGVRLHADALAPDSTDRIHALLERAAARHSGLGVTLPGRWRRSPQDAGWAADLGLRVRVVKGEWADPDEPLLAAREGFLAVIDSLAGRARHVSVATHDAPLLKDAVARLRAAGTPCDVELLRGLPQRACLRMAQRARVPVRVYVPWGEALLPHAVEYALARRAQMPGWFVRDALVR